MCLTAERRDRQSSDYTESESNQALFKFPFLCSFYEKKCLFDVLLWMLCYNIRFCDASDVSYSKYFAVFRYFHHNHYGQVALIWDALPAGPFTELSEIDWHIFVASRGKLAISIAKEFIPFNQIRVVDPFSCWSGDGAGIIRAERIFLFIYYFFFVAQCLFIWYSGVDFNSFTILLVSIALTSMMALFCPAKVRNQ